MRAENKITAEYLANAGVLLEADGACVGIDVFPCEPSGIYPDLSGLQFKKVLQKIAAGKLCALLFSHGHADHFNLEMTVKAVQTACENHHPLTIFSTRHVTDQLRRAMVPETMLRWPGSGWEQGNAFTFPDLSDWSVHAEIVPHDGAQYADVENLVFVLRHADKTLVFTGDAKPERALFERLASAARQIDWLFVPFPYYGRQTVRRMIRERLTVENTALMHFPIPGKDPDGWIPRTMQVCAAAKDGLPDPVCFKTPGEMILL